MNGGSSGRAKKLLAPCVRASKGRIAIGLTCAMLASAVNLSIPWTLKLAIDDVFCAKTIALSTLVAGLLLAYVFKNVFVLIGRSSMLAAGENTAFMVRRLLFFHVQSLSINSQAGKQGESLSRLTGDVSQVEGFVETGIPKTFNTVLMLTGALVIIFLKNPTLAAISLGVLPLHLMLYIAFRKPIKSGNRRMRESQADLSSGIVETVLGARAMAASTAEDRERDRFFDRASNVLNSKLKLGSMRLWQKALAELALGLGTVGVWYYGGRMVIDGPMEKGEFLAFLGYVAMLYPLSLTLMTQMGHTLGAVTSAERIMDLVEAAPDLADSPEAVALPKVTGRITFEDVGFSHNGTSAGIRGLSTAVEPGEVVAVTGPVGVGKSTLGLLLARFYDVDRGRISLDNVDLRMLPLQQLRSEIGIVFQEPFVFSDTIANNIRYSRPEANDLDVTSAADAAGLSPLVETLPDGLDAMIGEDGIQLSLGQKRRINMARALIKNPRVMVLDSGFTEGDAEHQFEETRAFARVSRDRTTFVINPPSFILDRATKVIRLRRNGMIEVEERASESGVEIAS